MSARCGGRVLRVVVDTNVWFSGLMLPESIPGQVLEAVRDRRAIPVASWDLATEITRVLRSPKLRKYRVSEADVSEALAFLAPFLPKAELDVTVRDPTDISVVQAALFGEAEAIVTGDRDLLDDGALRRRLAERGIRILTPKELMTILRAHVAG